MYHSGALVSLLSSELKDLLWCLLYMEGIIHKSLGYDYKMLQQEMS